MKYNNAISTGIPTVNGTWVDYGGANSSEVKYPFCNVEYSDGILLSSGSQSINNISCEAHSYNAGNYYNFPAASASTPEPASSSVCSKGWMLSQYNRDTGYSYFLEVYGIDYDATTLTNHDAGLVNLPLSLMRSGRYDYNSVPSGRNMYGIYRASSFVMNFFSGNLRPAGDTLPNWGFPVRCVGR